MFGNMKNNLPPRPQPPLAQQILEDILVANKDDVVFKLATLATKEKPGDDSSHYPMNTSDTELVYRRLETYLRVKENLTELSDSLRTENQVLQASDLEMKKIAEEIRRQAQEALAKQ